MINNQRLNPLRQNINTHLPPPRRALKQNIRRAEEPNQPDLPLGHRVVGPEEHSRGQRHPNSIQTREQQTADVPLQELVDRPQLVFSEPLESDEEEDHVDWEVDGVGVPGVAEVPRGQVSPHWDSWGEGSAGKGDSYQ